MLVAMALFFMAVGILGSAVTQALRLAEMDRREIVGARDDFMRLGWFRETIGLAVVPSPGNGEPFKGTSQAMSGTTLKSLDTANSGPGIFSWRIAFNQVRGESELHYVPGRGSPRVVFSWPGADGQFQYLDESGNWTNRWPATNRNAPAVDGVGTAIPRVVALEYGMEKKVLVAAVQNRSAPLPSLKELLK
jgi:hypothetical protein